MKRCIIGGILLAAAFGIVLTSGERAAAGKDKKSETIKLFNGKDLEGWEGYMDLWSVKDGVIVAKTDKALKYSTYLFTKQKFTDFRLVFSAKLVKAEMHSGVAISGVRSSCQPKSRTPPPRRRSTPIKGISSCSRRVGDCTTCIVVTACRSPKETIAAEEGGQAARLERYGDSRDRRSHPFRSKWSGGARLA